jgi:hypothetical protein
MSVSISRYLLGWAMVILVPLSLLGQAPSAILHTQGGVWVNSYEGRDSTAIFSGDVIETKPEFSAKLTLEGSEVSIQQESVGKFQGNFFELDHGSVAVGTSTIFKVKVNCITVVPVANQWTQYEVTDVNGTVQVSARKSDVNVEHEGQHKSTANVESDRDGTVREGEQKSYNESEICGAPPQPHEAAHGLNPKWIGAGAAAGGGILICVFLCTGKGSPKTPISPDKP